MQSFITNSCVKQILFVCCIYKNKIRHINIIQHTEYTLNNEINKNMVILEKFRKKYIKFGLIMTKKYLLQHLIAD
jgi:hypothetical protein